MERLRTANLPEEMRRVFGFLYKNYTEEELKSVLEAYEFAKLQHAEQFRRSGEPYIIHPLKVAQILAEMKLDTVSIKAGLLHDVVEDTATPLLEIEQRFGKEVARIVDGVTKIDRLKIDQKNFDQKAETVLKMFFAMSQDIRVIMVKLADRLHNMRTMEFQSPETQKKKAKETLQIFTPIAHRLGIYTIKWQLEDLSFKYLYPEEYAHIASLVDSKRADRELIAQEYLSVLQLTLARNGIQCEISGREKHFYSIWKKMNERGKNFDEIYDLIAVRVITNTDKECYYVLGLVHNLWKPIPGRVKDYIATPKSNGYRSLHTTVITHRGEPLEIQIRDKEMHNEAEFGLAAHWIYKEGKMQKYQQTWLKKLQEWHQDYEQGVTGLNEFQKEIQLEDVYIFSPKGELKHMQKGATTIDFAYSVHTEVGHHYAGAKVNGKIVPIGYELQNGDIVEIIVNKNNPGPSLDWLKYAKSSSTRAKIRRFFKEKDAQVLIEEGKDILRQVAKKLQKSMEDLLESDELKQYLGTDRQVNEKDLLLRIGEKEHSAEDIAALFQPPAEEPLPALGQPDKKQIQSKTIVVDGQLGIEVKMAKCCFPVPGDRIVGVISRKGITIHQDNCPNVEKIMMGELVSVQWGNTEQERYMTQVILESNDHSGNLLKSICQSAKERSYQITEVNTKFDEINHMTYRLSIYVKSLAQLEEMMEYWRKQNGIVNVYRTRGEG
ncbi:MAG TPA: bifunctional (p)ppGpp synthetase/guanosine-3',5'-bis(diphosphate) 3'-pyrophosphohydrolase [Thermotogota bacterium]|nr:bifunctional (p)ppGpp synthetase/guanosine-3',5'-bis(diphosphate) 3'-pyrophosphohydrolase [Thermotogota bacterium]HNR63050.1 bifunctional (p)ppGpp synthetase/guanosine-3',5'-bis(diphosphate) 3'-pyrophosphohydrolase [Thermotogota bacterium]HNT95200.1 bifunctional (p)ppGpp synthetase/guanosine-3',5'-bis(diphosphate) 3'-pyrophosphohydrolase [Thermotogota bacterium]HOZ11338.1 bifunctional (p)ppGpp synthetase/guanosine-3',5'-bis(diphosphate) 3'-pyrophosphohydrolase [Thermotogota bacterium]HPH0964